MTKSLFNQIITCALFTLSITQVKGQCTADAGTNIMTCKGDSVILGGSPTVVDGIGPLIYVWSAAHKTFTTQVLTASIFLNDTTVSNPLYISQLEDDSVSFYLSVTDSLGNSCYDTVSVMTGMGFGITLDDKGATIEQGGTASLYTSVGGGVPPLQYLWSPSVWVFDSTDVYTAAKPDTTTKFELLVTDALGCTVKDQFWVFVSPTSIEDIEGVFNLEIFPNPLSETGTVKTVVQNTRELTLNFYGTSGQVIKQMTILNELTPLESSDFEAGAYIYKLFDSTKLLGQGKLIVE